MNRYSHIKITKKPKRTNVRWAEIILNILVHLVIQLIRVAYVSRLLALDVTAARSLL